MRRAALSIVLTAGAAHAAPASITIDVDGKPTHVELGGDGSLAIGNDRVAVTSAGERATIAAAVVAGAPTIVVERATEAVIVARAGKTWKVAGRAPIGGVGLDADYSIAIAARPDGLYRYQTRPGLQRCDGKPPLLFAEKWDGAKFAPAPAIPSDVPAATPVVVARADNEPAAAPKVFYARFASHEANTTDVGGLGVPKRIDDGDPTTALVTAAGDGQLVTYQRRLTDVRAAQVRYVPARSHARPRRIAVVAATGALRIELPDAQTGAFVADLPAPIDGCVTIVVESTYGGGKELAIAELEVFAEGERSGGGEALLVKAVASGSDGAQAAAAELARRGADGVRAIEKALPASTGEARTRLARALIAMKDPAAAPLIVQGITERWIAAKDLVPAIQALADPQHRNDRLLEGLVADKDLAMEARVAAVRLASPAKLYELAGSGPRALRRAIIDRLAELPARELVAALGRPNAHPDLVRAAVRSARRASSTAERSELATILLAALKPDIDYQVAYRAVDGLATLGDASALAAVGRYLAADESPRGLALRQVAARAIAENPRPEAFELLVVLARDRDPGVRLAALAALAAQDGGTAGPWHGPAGPDGVDRVVVAALHDAWPEVRRAAAQSLGTRCARVGPARALVDSVQRDSELDVRRDALAALVQCKADGVAALLARTWDDGKAPIELRQFAIDLVVALDDPALAQKLVDRLARWRGAALEDKDALALVPNAAYAIGRLAPRGAAELLVAALEDSAFPEIVAAAATGLGLMGPRCPASAKGKLAALARSDDANIAQAAHRAAAVCGR